MIGHECRLSRTNTNGVVWVCQCGEIGDVVPMRAPAPGAKRRSARLVEITEGIARARHGTHLDQVRADVARRSDAELARIGKLIPLANRTLQHRGRWGHPQRVTLPDVTANEPGAVPGNPAGFIRSLIAEGEGPTAGLQIFRDNGGKIMDSRWFELYRLTADTLARTPGTLGLDPFSIPSPGEYSTWALGRGRQYMTQVQITLYDRGIGTMITTPYTHVTDEPHTIAEAEDAAMDQFDPLNTGADYEQTMMGAVATDVAQTVPYGSIQVDATGRPDTLVGWSDARLRAHVAAVLADPGAAVQVECAICQAARDRGLWVIAS